MSYNVKTIAAFEHRAKKLTKKYKSLQSELWQLIQELKENPMLGESLGKGCYKIRLAIASKGKGKSGGARVITHVHVTQDTVYLLSIYDKSERENIPDQEIEELLRLIRE